MCISKNVFIIYIHKTMFEIDLTEQNTLRDVLTY